jgi:hypothetical protein
MPRKSDLRPEEDAQRANQRRLLEPFTRASYWTRPGENLLIVVIILLFFFTAARC